MLFIMCLDSTNWKPGKQNHTKTRGHEGEFCVFCFILSFTKIVHGLIGGSLLFKNVFFALVGRENQEQTETDHCHTDIWRLTKTSPKYLP